MQQGSSGEQGAASSLPLTNADDLRGCEQPCCQSFIILIRAWTSRLAEMQSCCVGLPMHHMEQTSGLCGSKMLRNASVGLPRIHWPCEVSYA